MSRPVTYAGINFSRPAQIFTLAVLVSLFVLQWGLSGFQFMRAQRETLRRIILDTRFAAFLPLMATCVYFSMESTYIFGFTAIPISLMDGYFILCLFALVMDHICTLRKINSDDNVLPTLMDSSEGKQIIEHTAFSMGLALFARPILVTLFAVCVTYGRRLIQLFGLVLYVIGFLLTVNAFWRLFSFSNRFASYIKPLRIRVKLLLFMICVIGTTAEFFVISFAVVSGLYGMHSSAGHLNQTRMAVLVLLLLLALALPSSVLYVCSPAEQAVLPEGLASASTDTDSEAPPPRHPDAVRGFAEEDGCGGGEEEEEKESAGDDFSLASRAVQSAPPACVPPLQLRGVVDQNLPVTVVLVARPKPSVVTTGTGNSIGQHKAKPASPVAALYLVSGNNGSVRLRSFVLAVLRLADLLNVIWHPRDTAAHSPC